MTNQTNHSRFDDIFGNQNEDGYEAKRESKVNKAMAESNQMPKKELYEDVEILEMETGKTYIESHRIEESPEPTNVHSNQCHRRTRSSKYVAFQPVCGNFERMYANGEWYTEESIERFIPRIIERDAWFAMSENRAVMGRNEVLEALSLGKPLQFDTEWYTQIRRVIKSDSSCPSLPMTKCACGHTIPTALKMTTSSGSSCPSCYDRMSS